MNGILASLLALCCPLAITLCSAAEPKDGDASAVKPRDGKAFTDEERPDQPLWAVNWGSLPITKTRNVNLARSNVTDAELAKLKKFGVQHLWLDGTRITGAGLLHLQGLHVQSLFLRGTKLTDAGLEHVEGFSHLESLDLGSTRITNTGLEHLKGLPRLRELWLDGTQVTDQDVKELQKALPKCKVHWMPPTSDERRSPAAPDQLR
jgi:hypothetical protein